MRIFLLLAWINGLLSLIVPECAIAQVVPDNTLDSKVTSSPDHTQLLITGGSANRHNLFHSFDRFSLSSGQTAVFAPDSSIANIIARVTGNTISNIDGTIAVNGNANLFLINPNGIAFGQNASLAINGSFLATTAPGLKFADGTIVSANKVEPPLLTISTPVGVVQPAAPITNAGNLSVGQDLSIVAEQVSGSGQFSAGNRISITANTLTLDQAKMTIATRTKAAGIDLNVQDAIALKSSQINSTIESGTQIEGGDINVKARSLTLLDGATINTLIQPNAQGRSGNVNLSIQDSLSIDGESRDTRIPSGITSMVNGQGIGGNITVDSGSLQMSGGSNIFTVLNGTGNAGSIALKVRNNLQLQGAGSQQTRIGSAVSTEGIGQGGDVRLIAGTVSLADRAKIDTYTDGAGAGGGVDVMARDRITIKGTGRVEPIWTELLSTLLLSKNLTFENGFVTDQGQALFPISAVIFSTTKQTGILAGSAIGKTGDLQLSAPNIAITDQALISANNWRIGDSGSIKLTATEGVIVKDAYLFASVLIGKGANLEIDAPNFTLDHSKIVAGTGYATGGSITLNVPNVLLLRNETTVAAKSYNNANGGNIYINAKFVVAKPNENSDIIANAFRGRGGNIEINARSMLGMKNSSTQTSQSDISASSKFGISGEVKLNVLRSDPGSEAVKLPTEVTDSSNQIAQTCSATSRTNRLTVTGRGGIAPDLSEINRSTPVWIDSRTPNQSSKPQVRVNSRMSEATSWIKNSLGQIVLVADSPSSLNLPAATCSSEP